MSLIRNLKKISLKDKGVFSRYLGIQPHELSVYAFENIYIWNGLFDIEWLIIEDSLCVFFRDKSGAFLYLTPQARHKKPAVVKKVFAIMDNFNQNKDISRIENIEQKDACFYQDLGLSCKEKSYDYVCARDDLAKLQGNKFKSKRACFNYFIKNYQFEYLPFSSRYSDECVELYNCWMQGRKTKNQDRIYQDMLEDSRSCLKIALDNYSDLDLVGTLVKINKEVKAFTFGFKLNKDTFCILYEITDLSVKGLAQFIFSRFCQELKDYKYINIMDDSGLENLKKVKLSYHPTRLISAYIVKRKDGSTHR